MAELLGYLECRRFPGKLAGSFKELDLFLSWPALSLKNFSNFALMKVVPYGKHNEGTNNGLELRLFR